MGAPGKLAPKGRDWVQLPAGARGRDAAVSSTTPAGCGRGRDGRVRGEWRESRSRECDGTVTEGDLVGECRERRPFSRLLQTLQNHVTMV